MFGNIIEFQTLLQTAVMLLIELQRFLMCCQEYRLENDIRSSSPKVGKNAPPSRTEAARRSHNGWPAVGLQPHASPFSAQFVLQLSGPLRKFPYFRCAPLFIA